MLRFLTTFAAAAAIGGAAIPAYATPLTLVDKGITYTLTETPTANPLVAGWDLNITGINGPADVASTDGGGRSGVNAIAFNTPNNFVSATMTSPAGFNFLNEGLNSSGCHGGGSFFCFDNTGIPPTPSTPYAANSTLDFLFTTTISSGSYSGYTTDLKIDWVGSKNNYDLVSLNIPINIDPPPSVPEPGSLSLVGVGLLGVGMVVRRRRKV